MEPLILSFSDIDRSSRLRTAYFDIDSLADSIEHNGLIQPIVLSTTNGSVVLNAGGRRCAALELLLATGRWDGILYHGATSDPKRIGFVMKSEGGTELSNLLTEIAENLDRQDVSWRDNLLGIIRAARLIRQQSYANGISIVQRDLGAIIGCGYQDLRAAEAVYEDITANPKDYEIATTIRNAYQILLKKQEAFLMRLHIQRTAMVIPSPIVQVQNEPSQEQPPYPELHISLRLHQSSWYDIDLAPTSVDHIITDPDFALSVGLLSAKSDVQMVGYATGVSHLTVEDSLADMNNLFALASLVLKPSGFFVFFYDLDHHEKLQALRDHYGFSGQNWPIIWHKTDYRSNTAPAYNFCKNMEYAMVCRKPGAVLASSPQMSSIFSCPSGGAPATFGHPFAKPAALWNFLFSAICTPGQTVFDPCAGAGSMPCAAVDFGLNPIACEINPEHHTRLVYNVQAAYRTKYGQDVKFQ